MKVLDSVRVLEIGGLGPGPFCAMHLADLGADVISVVREAPNAGPTGNLLNRGKRSVFADLKTDDGRRLVLDLVKDADALIEGMRPGVMERLGLGPADCHAVNPRLVYGRMTGWGQSGPLAPRAGHDNNYAAVSGALWGSSPAGARPVSPFAVLGDIGGGALYLMAGLLGAFVFLVALRVLQHLAQLDHVLQTVDQPRVGGQPVLSLDHRPVPRRREQEHLAVVGDEERPRAGDMEARQRPGVGALLDRQLKFRRHGALMTVHAGFLLNCWPTINELKFFQT